MPILGGGGGESKEEQVQGWGMNNTVVNVASNCVFLAGAKIFNRSGSVLADPAR